MSSSVTHDHRDDRDEPQEHEGAPGGHDHRRSIKIVVITTAEDLDRRFDLDEPLRNVFERALKLVGGSGQADQFTLEYRDQPLTELDRKLGDLARELGWRKHVELELVPKPVVV
jgi:hypothetical protein